MEPAGAILQQIAAIIVRALAAITATQRTQPPRPPPGPRNKPPGP